MNKKTILFIATDSGYFLHHLLPLAQAARKAGYALALAGVIRPTDIVKLNAEQITYYDITIHRSSFNALKDVKLLFGILGTIFSTQPDIVHTFGMKPILYATIATFLNRLLPFHKYKLVNTFTGMGFLFTNDQSIAVKVVRAIFVQAMRFLQFMINLRDLSVLTTVQNSDDKALLESFSYSRNIIIHCCVGVDIKDMHSNNTASEYKQNLVTCTLAARMLRDKGVLEFIEAAKILKAENIPVRMVLVGAIDIQNPSALSEEELQDPSVEWLGYQSDMSQIWHNTDIAVLPSYREGLSRTLLEAGACKKAVITTDAPGGRDLVTHMVNGLLVPVKDTQSLVNAIKLLVDNSELRHDLAANMYNIVITKYQSQSIAEEATILYYS